MLINDDLERSRKSRKVALTGTFNVSRSELEKRIREAGHEVGELSSSTQVLLVGEKTASLAKIQKAREKFFWILESTNPEVILNLLAIRTSSGYFSSYDREFDHKEGEVGSIDVCLPQVVDVYADFVDQQGDAGEWFDEDALSYLMGILKNPTDFFNNLWGWVGVEIENENKLEFLIAFSRLCFLDAILEPGVWETIKVKDLMSPKFYKNFNFLSLAVICDDFEIAELRKEIADDDEKMSLIKKAQDGEIKFPGQLSCWLAKWGAKWGIEL